MGPLKQKNLVDYWLLKIFLGAFLMLSQPITAQENHEEVSLKTLITQAWKQNVTLKRLEADYNKLTEQANASRYWPDPVIGGQYFIKPIETRLGAQKLNLALTQPIPFPGKLSAQSEVLQKNAESIRQKILAMRLALAYDIKKLFYQGSFLHTRTNILKLEEQFLDHLTQLALARVKVGQSMSQDVVRVSLESSRLQQQILETEKALYSLQSKINTLLNRPSETPVRFSKNIAMPSWVKDAAWQKQLGLGDQAIDTPEIKAAQAEVAAAEANMHYSKLKWFPDIKASVTWFRIDEQNQMSVQNKKNEDAWAVGAQISLPLWFGKYLSYDGEAQQHYQNKYLTHQDLLRQVKNEVDDLVHQIELNRDLLLIYETTMLPQAEQVMKTSEDSYRQSAVSFDRVIEDYRKFLDLKLKYEQGKVVLMTAIARLEQLLGKNIDGP